MCLHILFEYYSYLIHTRALELSILKYGKYIDMEVFHTSPIRK
jgi:hypothetical protein